MLGFCYLEDQNIKKDINIVRHIIYMNYVVMCLIVFTGIIPLTLAASLISPSLQEFAI